MAFDWIKVKPDASNLVLGYRFGLLIVRESDVVHLYDGIGADRLFMVKPTDIWEGKDGFKRINPVSLKAA